MYVGFEIFNSKTFFAMVFCFVKNNPKTFLCLRILNPDSFGFGFKVVLSKFLKRSTHPKNGVQIVNYENLNPLPIWK